MILSSLVAEFEKIWPSSHAEPWDVVGLVSGNSKREVKKILLTVDLTEEVISEAINLEVDLIFAHHPLLLKGINTVEESTSKGSLLSKLIKSDIALFAAHTNADVQRTGTSAALANALKLKNQRVLVETAPGLGLGIIGELENYSLGDLAGTLNQVLPATATGVRVAGDFQAKVSKIALCAGAGDSYLQVALDAGADVFITSDLRHHPAQEILELAKARRQSFFLIDISHWAAEYIWLEQAKADLNHLGLETVISDIRTDVFDFLMNIPRSVNES
ncbi:MAG: Nif3-like dinuclear metal center hexameric protein [Micrococcales bacterium]|nr:Nif3-like dinuclear metal center hexameric protein [Micrococcales bacterium]NBR54504.1 Nif3-like dinuclear metal center hexameric protein [Micrococcales bacterium]NBR60942.1 Nif3-like dinuclear metal center hexameric protein [Actinomycetota bacterium]NBT46908.1 Nif3-like dinuclear metal center hexameric protein [Actinomycetota bacterium]NBY43788.1 Nif3-like dinuclear metal center hexameric protein [Micrococcales bacterium]